MSCSLDLLWDFVCLSFSNNTLYFSWWHMPFVCCILLVVSLKHTQCHTASELFHSHNSKCFQILSRQDNHHWCWYTYVTVWYYWLEKPLNLNTTAVSLPLFSLFLSLLSREMILLLTYHLPSRQVEQQWHCAPDATVALMALSLEGRVDHKTFSSKELFCFNFFSNICHFMGIVTSSWFLERQIKYFNY